MKKSLALLALILLLAAGYFIGNPTTKTAIANQTCTEFLEAPRLSLANLRGHLALAWQGGNRDYLADNCATYPTKPMAIYLGWHQYLKR
ncbi:MAG: hypothetical protein COY40_01885 [Alphaproteobacteria bacterium CG_4_10_14_0_8_um_filter_53_9]|nr:MAG: hypothetical protein COY40_01885 [Alphaproteobacteria bacterium CG_4_10_14_0_8_um_filter_53_9]